MRPMKEPAVFTDRVWATSYRSTHCDLLHDFYIPALSAAVYYDRVAGYFRSRKQ